MIRKLFLALAGFGMMAAAPAFAASDVSNSGAVSVQATTAVASPIAAGQTVSIISGAVSGGFSGAVGGFSGGGGGGFSPSGGGGGFSPSGGQQRSFLNSRDAGRAGGAGDKRFGAWMQGAYSTIDNNQAGLLFDGSVYNLVAGLDYMLSDRVVAGVAFGYESLDLTTAFNNGSTEGTGLSITPYIGFSLTNAWSVDLAASYGTIDYDVVRNTNIRGSFDAERWFVAGNLNGDYGFGRLRVMPKVGVLYLEEKSDSHVDSTGATVVGSTTKLGRISAGGRVGYAFDSVMPYVKVIGEYDFEKNAPVALSNGTFSHDDDMGAQLGVGFDFYGSNTFSGTVEAAYLSAGRTDLDVWTTSARLRVKF
ncbi:autotransporter outer membrane beta-barrel domain-containing protein [Ferrovibrio sp.]|uniref:autotransporter outer membrane beta-barrel domain-containing protein n=1 Tax=Ferrovibrio sp. TaxID=1917215 RepID=UPI001B56AA98|nr:autotransporter outer membrane beta-barrel domain-containing protein [Ferrovibrio sp.]MBP7065102.1 autotransporter outer membrane beta-barrel domain-containing protein [Ferrovibrio sp.]